MRLVTRSSVALLLLALTMLVAAQPALARKDGKINWMTIEEAETAAKKTPKPILVDIYTDWCSFCKRLDSYTFNNSVIINYINENFYAVKLNAEGADTLTFRRQKFLPRIQGKTHQLAIALTNGRLSYPTLVYIVKEYIVPVPGYQTPSQLEVFLNYFADGSYESVNWEEYATKFKGKLH